MKAWSVYRGERWLGEVEAETWMKAREEARARWPFPARVQRRVQVREVEA